MAEHGAFKMPGKNLSLDPVTRLSQLENEPGYRIFTECTRGGYRGVIYRKYLVKGTRIRIDLFSDFPLWKVKELLKCRNWVVDGKYGKYGCTTYYINILEA